MQWSALAKADPNPVISRVTPAPKCTNVRALLRALNCHHAPTWPWIGPSLKTMPHLPSEPGDVNCWPERQGPTQTTFFEVHRVFKTSDQTSKIQEVSEKTINMNFQLLLKAQLHRARVEAACCRERLLDGSVLQEWDPSPYTHVISISYYPLGHTAPRLWFLFEITLAIFNILPRRKKLGKGSFHQSHFLFFIWHKKKKKKNTLENPMHCRKHSD